MLIRLSIEINKILFLSFLIILPAFSYAATSDDFPFHIEKTVEKEVIYPYYFEDVWAESLEYLKRLDKEFKEKALRTNITFDKISGLLTYTITEKHSIIGGGMKSLTAHNILIKPVDEQKTKVYYHIITYYLYNFAHDVPLEGPEGPPRIIIRDPTANLEEIENRLKKW